MRPKKGHPGEGWPVKVSEETSLEPVRCLRSWFAYQRVDCDSRCRDFSLGLPPPTSPGRGIFRVFLHLFPELLGSQGYGLARGKGQLKTGTTLRVVAATDRATVALSNRLDQGQSQTHSTARF